MENYYTDKRVLHTLEKSYDGGLMDILTFVKEIDFEIKDNLGFDVLWGSLNGRRYIYIYISLLEWLGYSGPKELQKQGFLNLLERNSIAYISVGYLDPLIEQFPDIQEEINQMRVIDKPRKRWLIMDSKQSCP
jgi:hypothetical protein